MEQISGLNSTDYRNKSAANDGGALTGDPVTEPARKRGRKRAVRWVITIASMPLSETIASLVSLQTRRRFLIKTQIRISNAMAAAIRSAMGWRLDLPEDERDKIAKRAAAFVSAVEKNKPHKESDAFAAEWGFLVIATANSRSAFDDTRSQIESDMRTLAKGLPVWESFGRPVRGFGELGLAITIAEAPGMNRNGLSDFATKERLWKRLGLAVINGERQQKSSFDAEAHGYNPQRRAEMWTLFTDSMFRAQWRAAKDEDGNNPAVSGKPVAVPAGPAGPFGEVYARRKAATEGRIYLSGKFEGKPWFPAHRHADACRVMTKAFIEALWKAWRNNTDPQ